MEEHIDKKLAYNTIAVIAGMQPDPAAFLQKIAPYVMEISDADVVERKNDIDKVSD